MTSWSLIKTTLTTCWSSRAFCQALLSLKSNCEPNIWTFPVRMVRFKICWLWWILDKVDGDYEIGKKGTKSPGHGHTPAHAWDVSKLLCYYDQHFNINDQQCHHHLGFPRHDIMIMPMIILACFNTIFALWEGAAWWSPCHRKFQSVLRG